VLGKTYLCNAIFAAWGTLRIDLNTSTIPHEIGHYFGIGAHTNEYANIPCLQEPVSRSWIWDFCYPLWWAPYQRCLTTGDFLYDTDAAPASVDFSETNYGRPSVNPSTDCIYTGNKIDYRGVRYHPDLQNYMLALQDAAKVCRSHFSPQQATIICSNMQADFPNYGQPWVGQPDIYELDNQPTSARTIQVGETQYHSQDLMTCSPDDWVRIYKPENAQGILGTQTLTIDEVQGIPCTVGSVEVYTGEINELGGIDGLSTLTLQIVQTGNKRIIQIPCDYLGAHKHVLIKITRAANATNIGWYKVNLSSNIAILPSFSNAAADICTGQPVSLNNIPSGATISWQGINLALSTNTGAVTTVTNFVTNSNNVYQLQATIQYAGCSYFITKDFIPRENGSVQIENLTNYDDLCTSRAYEYSAHTTGSWSSFAWSISPNSFSLSGSQTQQVEVSRASNGNFTLYLTATDGCGNHITSQVSDNLSIPTIAECRKRWAKLSPNPATNYINLDLSNYDDSKTIFVKIVSPFGNVVYEQPIPSIIFNIDVGSYAKGIYYVEIISDYGVENTSFIVQ
jgi:hypothetical protein